MIQKRSPRAPSLLAMMPVQWHRVLGGGGEVPAFLSEMAPRVAAASGAPPAAVQHAACAVSLDAVLDVVKRTAGSAIDADAPLMEAGLDSLGAVELRTRLASRLNDVELPETLVFDYPTVRQLEAHVGGLVAAPTADKAAASAPQAKDLKHL